MIPADPPSSPNESEPRDPLPKGGQRRDPDEDLWDLDAADQADDEDLHEELREDPLRPSASGEAGPPVSTRISPRPLNESEHVRKDLNAVEQPKEVRPVRALERVKGDFEPLDELTGLGDLEEPDLPAAPSAPHRDEAVPEVAPLASEPAQPSEAGEESTPSEDPSSNAKLPEAPFESPAKEEDTRETLLKELQKGWGPGLRFVAQRIRAFSYLEQLSCVLILIGIIGFSTAVFFPALLGFPQKQEFLESRDFPVRGKHIVVTDAETYWREPVTEGADADTVRLGVALLPVIDLKFKTDPGMIRLLFRNSEGRLVGDPLTRMVKGEQSLSLSATTGLRDTGMFSAYRTGEMEPWVVEVFEAPGSNTSSDAFEPVFKMTIAPLLK